ncbi:MAG: hypothetical protein H6551_02215 [Chitinophagales bacterium]|nr:hypothetical protein [Chitinophagaceae bacterium]MCB9063939.1 hypothetical protein [Chitinophagales bacterium]
MAIVFWGLAYARYYQKSVAITPARMAETVSIDLNNKQSLFGQLIGDEDLIKRIFSNDLSASDVSRLSNQPYGIYAYRNDTIVFWNSNKVLVDCITPPSSEKGGIYRNERGTFFKQCLTPKFLNEGEQLAILYPIVTHYPFENNYLHSSFDAADYIPVNTNIATRKSDNAFAVTDNDGKGLFYLNFSNTTLPVWEPGNTMKFIVILAILFSVFWIQLLAARLSSKRSFWEGFLLLCGVVIGVEVSVYYFGLPFNLSHIKLFNPQLYASSLILRSLGHLLMNALLFLWVVAFIVRHARIDILKDVKLNTLTKWVMAVVTAGLMILYCFAFINIISTLVTDSKISFDVSHFYTISTYTIVGLFIVSIITTGSFIVVYILSTQLRILINQKWLRYLLIVVMGLALFFISDAAADEQIAYLMLLWLLLMIILLDVNKLSLDADLFAPQMIFWAAFVIAFCTAVLQYFNYVKEQDARIRFAEKIAQQRDDITEYTFKKIGEDIQNDPVVRAFFKSPGRTKRNELDERFDALYLGGHFNKYSSKVLLYNAGGWALYNDDTLSYNALVSRVRESNFTFTQHLYYRKNATDAHYYIAYIPIEVGDSAHRRVIGHAFVDLAVKESTGESVYPELLQPGSVRGERNAEGYSYGVYVNNKLITQTSDYNFPIYLRDTLTEDSRFVEYAGSSELKLKTEDEKTVIVMRDHRLWLESITLFSYLFGIQMIVFLVSLFYTLYQQYFARKSAGEKIISFTLRRRIHISFLGIVFVSFIIIGVITILFFTYQYKQNSKRKQQLVMQLVERATLQHLQENNAMADNKSFNKEVADTRFRYFITGLANAQKIDINLYYASGVLNVTSQEGIYDRSLFARIINPTAYHALVTLGNQFLIQDEYIGQLSYISSYKPLRNKEGMTLGYLNIPFFSSEKELNYQISGIVVGLINLYAFVFLLSGVLTVFITRWITKSLSVVIKSFSRFSLSKNEPVDWPYDDEIGLLVSEYNRMVKKAEENAKLLAQSEREGAWREMAQQVAHEIKNPLTPMKLNIQYLQQALKNNYPNVEELAKKVSESLIEQIENLSYIASEFSNFAKMPEARPEKFDLNDLLQKTVDLYRNQSEVTVTFNKYDKPLMVYTDKSQLLRVCNNLLENAVQAIPEEREGAVVVSITTEGSDALIAFKDNGKGIEEDAMSRIFQPYFTTKSSGTGLGLAMTKKIIEFWKGTIRFETMPGKGTTFYITVPVANGDEL